MQQEERERQEGLKEQKVDGISEDPETMERRSSGPKRAFNGVVVGVLKTHYSHGQLGKNMLDAPWHQHALQGLRKDQINHEQGCVKNVPYYIDRESACMQRPDVSLLVMEGGRGLQQLLQEQAPQRPDPHLHFSVHYGNTQEVTAEIDERQVDLILL